jgi:phage tail-like protein
MSAPRQAILLNPTIGWRTGTAVNAGTLGPHGIALTGSAGTAAAFAVMPPWLAAPAWASRYAGPPPYVLGLDGWVRRYEELDGTFRLVLSATDYGLPAHGTALATSRDDIYLLAPGQHQVLVFSRLGYPRQVLRPPTGTAWHPAAVCGLPGGAAILDIQDGVPAIRWHRAGSLTLQSAPLRLGEASWSRIAAGRDESLYVLDAATGASTVISADHSISTVTTDGPAVEAAIIPPGTGVDRAGGLKLPGLTRRVDRSAHIACDPPDTTLTRPVLHKRGYWVSDQLDSHIYRCDWHRIRVNASLPEATAITLSTYGQDIPATTEEIAAVDPGAWRTMGPVQAGDNDLLVLSASARYLWVRIDLSGDGYSSPSVASMRLEYPRNSYLRFLPAIYSADPASASFLARYLAIAQTSVEDIEAKLAAMPALFDPKAVPDAFVDFLSGWLNVPVEGTFTPAQQRKLIDAARGYLRIRGTPTAIRRHVASYLHAMSGVTLPTDGLPQLIEGFRQRRYLTLPASLSAQNPLWSPGFTARLQLDRFDRLGQVRPVSVGDPALDMFTRHAHRFRVFVPAALAPRHADRDLLIRAISAEAPAETVGELVLVRPAMCLGTQSLLGLDTLLAAPAPIRLTCAGSDADTAGSRLGGLAVLGNASTTSDWQLGQQGPVGSLLPVS